MTKSGQSVTFKIKIQLDFQIVWQTSHRTLIANQCYFGQLISVVSHQFSS